MITSIEITKLKNQINKSNNENSKTESQTNDIEDKNEKYYNNFLKSNFKDPDIKIKIKKKNNNLYRNNNKKVHYKDNPEVSTKKFNNSYFIKNNDNSDQGTKIVGTENKKQVKEIINRNRFSNLDDEEKTRCLTHRSKKKNIQNDIINDGSLTDRNISSDAPKRRVKKVKITVFSYLQKLMADNDDIILFKNNLKENNCFLNAIIQVLFHLDKFKSKLMKINIINDEKDPISQLYNIFDDYNFLLSNYSANLLNVALLRESLHFKYGTYPKGKTGDPMETFSHLLDLVHNKYINNINDSFISTNSNNNKNFCDDYCNDEQCPSHSNFLLRLKEVKICPKCHKNNIINFNKDCFMYTVYSYELLSIIMNENYDVYHNTLFKKLKILGNSFGDNKIKLEGCTCSEINTEKRLLLCNKNSPYLIINLTWDSDFPPMSDICKIYGLITVTDSNSNLFDLYSKNNKNLKIFYFLFSMILYGQNHYTCCFYNKKLNAWSFIDDNSKKSFKSYTELIQYLIERRSIPVGMIYSDENYINIDNMKDYFLNEEVFKNIYEKSMKTDNNIFNQISDDDWDIELGNKIMSCKDIKSAVKGYDLDIDDKEKEKVIINEKELFKRASKKKMTK